MKFKHVAGLVVVLIVGYWTYFVYMQEDDYRGGMNYSGDLKIIESEFRHHFYSRTTYEPQSLEQLRDAGAFDTSVYNILIGYRYKFIPFSPSTDDSTVVLVVHGFWLNPDKFTKRDLTAAPDAPNHLR